MSLIVSAHQPNVFPWLGFFDKMSHSDILVYMDNVPFTRTGYQHRVKLKSAAGEQWLTVPVKKKGLFAQPTDRVEINNDSLWKQNHLKTFKHLYAKTSNYQKVMKLLEALYDDSFNNLIDFSIPSITLIKKMLGINTEVVKASELGIQGQRSTLLRDLVASVNGDVYLSGPSGRNYLDELVFKEADIDVRYHKFDHFKYPQKFGDFIPGLSSLDFIFNVSNIDFLKC